MGDLTFPLPRRPRASGLHSAGSGRVRSDHGSRPATGTPLRRAGSPEVSRARALLRAPATVYAPDGSRLTSSPRFPTPPPLRPTGGARRGGRHRERGKKGRVGRRGSAHTLSANLFRASSARRHAHARPPEPASVALLEPRRHRGAAREVHGRTSPAAARARGAQEVAGRKRVAPSQPPSWACPRPREARRDLPAAPGVRPRVGILALPQQCEQWLLPAAPQRSGERSESPTSSGAPPSPSNGGPTDRSDLSQ